MSDNIGKFNQIREKFGKLGTFQTKRESSFVKMMLYGPTGSGKTYCATRLPDEMSPLLVNFETKDDSVAEGIDQIRITSRKELGELYNLLSLTLKHGECPFDVLVLDGMTEYGDQVIDEIRSGNKSVLLTDSDIGTLSIAGWGVAGQRLSQAVRMFRDLPIHIIFTALEERDKDDMGKFMLMPKFFGKSQNSIPSYISHLGHMESQMDATSDAANPKIKYSIRFGGLSSILAKTEGGILDIIEPVGEDGLTSIINKLVPENKPE